MTASPADDAGGRRPEGRRLVAAGAGASLDPARLTRLLGVMWAAAGLVGIVIAVLPHPPDFRPLGVALPALAAVLFAPVLYRFGSVLPLAANRLATIAATLLVSVAAYFSGPLSPAVGILYIWIGTIAFTLFRRAEAVAHVALVAAAYGAVVATAPGNEGALARWFAVVSSVVFFTTVVYWLTEQIRRLASRARSSAAEAARVAEETERQSQYFASLLEISPTAIVTLDLDTNVTSWNPAAERLFGYTREEAVGRNVDDLIATGDLREEAVAYDRALREERVHAITRRMRKDGTLVDVELSAVPVVGHDGPIGYYAIYHDISELQRQKRFFQSLLDNSPTAIAAIDREDNVTAWNPAAETLFGYTAEEAIGRNVDDLVAASDEVRAEAVDVNRRATESGRVRLITRRTRKDGTLIDVEVLVAPVVLAGEVQGFFAIYHDIGELLQARKEAEAATHAKSAFLATMSHEIRTPMNAVIGMTGLLLDTELDREQREFAEIIRTSSDALLNVIDDILDFSKIEAGKLDLERVPFDLRECVEGALYFVATRAAEKGLDLAYVDDPGAPAAIVGDPTRLRQILLNLLSNAIKFTEEGEVVVAAGSDPAATGDGDGDARYLLHFTVRDTGIGIADERMDQLFQSFTQLDASTTRRYGGTGLGLAISKRLAEMMGGTMWAESEVGKGSTFHFTFLADAAQSVARAFEHGDARLTGKRVLIVDDNETNRQILLRYAQSWGMAAQATAAPEEALAWILRGDPFDVAVLDMQMPRMDGATLAAEIRRHRDTGALPIVLLTSLGRRADDALRGVAFDAFLTKPIKASQLYDALAGLFAREATEAQPLSSHATVDAAEPADAAPLRILLAEDNEVNQKLALALLAKMGYVADVARNGREVLQALDNARYDVVLMDVEMPEMDGLEATRQIRVRWRQDGPRIVAMTANAMQGDRDICLAAGMDEYLSKPIRPEQLAGALGRARPAVRAPAAEPAAERDVVDRATLDELAATLGDPAFVRELIATFLADAPGTLATVREGLEREEHDEVRRAAHTLKSNARTFGATALADACHELETLAHGGSLAGAAPLVEVVEAEYEAVAAALGALQEVS